MYMHVPVCAHMSIYEHACMRRQCLARLRSHVSSCQIKHASSICTFASMAHLFKDIETYERFKKAYDAVADTGADAASNIVSMYDIMMECMTVSGMVQVLLLPPHVVGVHPQNRGGQLMSATAMMARGARIITVGTSKQLCGPSK